MVPEARAVSTVTPGAAGPQDHGKWAASIPSRRAGLPELLSDLDNPLPGTREGHRPRYQPVRLPRSSRDIGL